MKRIFLLGTAWLVAGCTASSPFAASITVHNPTVRTFEGSGGALGAGLEFRVDGLEGGQALVVDQECAGRKCGEPALTDPGHCGDTFRSVDPGNSVIVNWDGRYFPRSWDPLGACLGAARAVTADRARLTLCGRLMAPDVTFAPLLCEEHELLLPGTTQQATLDVPGASGVAVAHPG